MNAAAATDTTASDEHTTSGATIAAMNARINAELRRIGLPTVEIVGTTSGPARSLTRDPHGRARVTVRTDRILGVVAEDTIAGIMRVNKGAKPRLRYTPDEIEHDLWLAALGLGPT